MMFPSRRPTVYSLRVSGSVVRFYALNVLGYLLFVVALATLVVLALRARTEKNAVAARGGTRVFES